MINIDARVKPAVERILVGEDITFTCTIYQKGPPGKFLYWQTPNGTHLPDSDPHTVVTNNGTELHIINATLSDAGTYNCVYLDENSLLREPAVLYVSGKLKAIAPTTQYLIIGRPGYLACHGEGKGISAVRYRWKFNHHEILGVDPNRDVAKNGNLVFKNVTEKDAGNYTCIVKTTLQEDRKTIQATTLNISDLPKPPSECKLDAKFSHINVCFTIPESEKATATKYKIMYWPTGAPMNVTTKIIESSKYKCPVDISGLVDDTSYDFRFAVSNNIAYGAESKVFTAKTNRAKCPRVPTEVKFDVYYTHVVASWMPPDFDGGAPVDDYRVDYRKNDTDMVFVMKTGKKSPITITGLEDNTEYEFKVAAHNRRCWGPSYEAIEMTLRLAEPSMPTELFLRSTDHSITVSWKPPTNDHGRKVTEYRLEYRMVGDANWITIDNATTPYTLSQLTYNKEYQIQVSAKNQIGWGKPKKSQTKTIVINPPTAPRNISIENIKYDSMTVSWMAPISDNGAPITAYKVEYQIRAGKVVSKNWFSTQTKADVMSASVTKLNGSTSYNVRVGAINTAGITYSSPLKTVKTAAAPMAPFTLAIIIILSIVGALIVADIILYFALDTGVTKKVVEKVQNKSGYEKAPEGGE
ncbi:Titin [Trichoplax sp. H2]|nr:Titin [Trichoplax sp. H2]|eukprot:RDD36853.1 Titin [Trichoplax sp. H2]